MEALDTTSEGDEARHGSRVGDQVLIDPWLTSL